MSFFFHLISLGYFIWVEHAKEMEECSWQYSSRTLQIPTDD